METEPPWEQGQSDFPSQGVRDTLPHVSRATRRHSCPPAVEILGDRVPETIGRFPYPDPSPSLAVFSLSCCAHCFFRPKSQGFMKVHLAGFACSCSKACSRLELGFVKWGRLCTPAENSLCIHTAHPPRSRSAAWLSVDISMLAFPVLSR